MTHRRIDDPSIFQFTEVQNELRSVVRRFVEDHATDAYRDGSEVVQGYDPKIWDVMGRQLGLTALGVPEEFGGAGTFVEASVVLEEMGYRLFMSPYLSTVIATTMLVQTDDSLAMEMLLPGIAAGETTATVAFVEAEGRWDTQGMATAATMTAAGDYQLSGEKLFVLDGHVADYFMVLATTGKGPSLFMVEASASGLRRYPMPVMDSTRPQSRLEFHDVTARLVGPEGQAAEILERTLEVACAALAVEQVGGAQFVLEAAVEHAQSRVQFGRRIGSFQAVKHKCADMLVAIESARSASYYAARCVSLGSPMLAEMSSLAKSHCSETYLSVAAENIQIHGAIGFTDEHFAHRYYRRAKSSELLFGDPSHHRQRYARLVGI